MEKIKTIFFGSGEFAVPILKKLIELDYLDLVLVVTQPDKPVGRKQELTPTPVGQLDINVEILKPEKIRLEAEEILGKYSPELIIVASYGQIIPASVINFPKFKCLNFHGSLLPQLRGAVPVQMAILQGLEETGVTLQVMSEGMDEGDIISQEVAVIKEDDTSESLMRDLAELSVTMLERDLPKWIGGELKATKQDESSASAPTRLLSYCFKDDISKSKAEITSSTTIDLADRMIRAFYPWPIAWIKLSSGKILKIYKAEKTTKPTNLEVLSIFREEKSLFLVLSDGVIELKEIQLEGKTRGFSQDYLFLAS